MTFDDIKEWNNYQLFDMPLRTMYTQYWYCKYFGSCDHVGKLQRFWKFPILVSVPIFNWTEISWNFYWTYLSEKVRSPLESATSFWTLWNGGFITWLHDSFLTLELYRVRKADPFSPHTLKIFYLLRAHFLEIIAKKYVSKYIILQIL